MSWVLDAESLRSALAPLHPVDDAAAARLVAWSAILDRWQRVQRLVGWRDGASLLKEGLADAWAVLPLLARFPGRPLVDLGSGAGLPGLVLAAAEPGREVHLVEQRRKRAAFLREAARAMELRRVQVWHEDAAKLRGRFASPLLSARAFAEPAALLAEAALWGNDVALLQSLSRSDAAAIGIATGWSLLAETPGVPARTRVHRLLSRI
jgi:16S rRNA (guanine527-N7)-methyltransferase